MTHLCLNLRMRLKNGYQSLRLNCFEALFAVLLLPSAVSWIVSPETFAPVTINQALNSILVRIMGAMLLVGAVQILFGLIMVVLRQERAGLVLWASSLLLYVYVLLTAPGPNHGSRTFAIAIFSAFAVACVWRYQSLGVVLKRIQAVREVVNGHETD